MLHENKWNKHCYVAVTPCNMLMKCCFITNIYKHVTLMLNKISLVLKYGKCSATKCFKQIKSRTNMYKFLNFTKLWCFGNNLSCHYLVNVCRIKTKRNKMQYLSSDRDEDEDIVLEALKIVRDVAVLLFLFIL